MEAARWHLRIANYIEKCNYNKAKPADDHVCNYDEDGLEEELVIGTSAEDWDCLGLSPSRTSTPTPATKKSWYNPLNGAENEEILWISPETTRLE